MMAALFLVPLLAGLAAFVIRPDGLRRAILLGVAVAHAGLTAAVWRYPLPLSALDGLLSLDELGLLFLSITSALFVAAAFYGVGYLRREHSGLLPARRPDFDEGFLFSNAPEAVFTGCLLLFLAMMTLVSLSGHFGLTWVAVEATTLASAPLIYFHRHHRSLEATWKYLLICSVGIALALLGIFLVALAGMDGKGAGVSLLTKDLVGLGGAHKLNPAWLKPAFVFLLVGYGTKMGLAPLHTWLPDAHSESPSVVSALLSGALLNCAFLSILRGYEVLGAAGCAAFGRDMLVLLGLVSMGVAAVFIVGQQDYKRMLAYSSVEHVGILALGVGLGGAGAFGAMLHAVNHSLTKAMLFLVAGNILTAYGTKSCRDIRGALGVLPVSGALWLAGFLAITGSPPFGPFFSEFTVLKAALDQGHAVVAALYLGFLCVIFLGMAGVFLRMTLDTPGGEAAALRAGRAASPGVSRATQGRSSLPAGKEGFRESWLSVVPPMALGAVVLALGVWMPAPLADLLHRAARAVGGF